jgi:hypothetical protein
LARRRHDCSPIVMDRIPCSLRVADRQGTPLAGVTFAVERAEGPVPEIAYVTDPGGLARLGLPPGKVAIRFILPNGTRPLISVVISRDPGRTYEIIID